MGNPEAIDLIRELRTALGLFDGAMPVAPREAWDEALGVARKLTTGRCWACLGSDGRRIPRPTTAGASTNLPRPEPPDDYGETPPWADGATPDANTYMESELFVAGTLSTMEPFASYNPVWALPFARAALDGLGRWEPTDA